MSYICFQYNFATSSGFIGVYFGRLEVIYARNLLFAHASSLPNLQVSNLKNIPNCGKKFRLSLNWLCLCCYRWGKNEDLGVTGTGAVASAGSG